MNEKRSLFAFLPSDTNVFDLLSKNQTGKYLVSTYWYRSVLRRSYLVESGAAIATVVNGVVVFGPLSPFNGGRDTTAQTLTTLRRIVGGGAAQLAKTSDTRVSNICFAPARFLPTARDRDGLLPQKPSRAVRLRVPRANGIILIRRFGHERRIQLLLWYSRAAVTIRVVMIRKQRASADGRCETERKRTGSPCPIRVFGIERPSSTVYILWPETNYYSR